MGDGVTDVYEFGPYRLDPVKRVLLKDGEPVPLTPKALETLLALVESGGTLVEKDALIKKVWPDSFVEEGNLTVNISMLRKALGESPSEHRYIVTVPGRGYRFVADIRIAQAQGSALMVEERTRSVITIEQQEQKGVAELPASEAIQQAPISALEHSRRLFGTRQLVILLIVLVVAGGILYLNPWGWPIGHEKDWRASLATKKVWSAKGDPKESINGARFSPDATMFAYSAAGADNGLNLWVKQIDGGDGFHITDGPWYDESPLWSPDRSRIAFVSDRNNRIGIWTVASLGRQDPTLLATISPDNKEVGGDTGLLRWSTIRPVIYYCWKSNVYEVDLNSRVPTRLTHFDEDTPYDMEIHISPDEKSIAYVVEKDGLYNVWRSAINGDKPVQVTGDEELAQSPIWHTDGRRIIYSSIKDGGYVLKMAYVDGRPPQVITSTDEEGYVWDVSQDGTKLLYFGKRDESGLCKIDMNTGQETQIGSDVSGTFWPQASPTASDLAFQRLRAESTSFNARDSSIMISPDGSLSQTRELAPGAFGARWSPDGKDVAFLRQTKEAYDLFVIGAVGGGERRIATGVTFGGSTQGPPYNLYCTRDIAWSPDSASLAISCSKDRTSNLCVVSADGGRSTEVASYSSPDTRITSPSWSSDGKRLAYVTEQLSKVPGTPPTSTVWVTDFRNTVNAYSRPLLIRLLGWSASNDALLLAQVEDSGYSRAFPADVSLMRVAIGGSPQQVSGNLPLTYFSNVHLSPDERNVLFESSYMGRDNVWLVPVDGGARKQVTANQEPRTYYAGLCWSPDGKYAYCAKQSTSIVFKVYSNFK